jgi:tetratricopeptide (TPR) repeat protein
MSYKVKHVTIEEEDTNEIRIKKYKDAIKKYPDESSYYLSRLIIIHITNGEMKKSFKAAKGIEKFYSKKTNLTLEEQKILEDAKYIIEDKSDDENYDDESLDNLINDYESDPDYENMERLGDRYFDLGQYDKAEEYYFMLLSTDVPWNVDTYDKCMTRLFKRAGKKKNIKKDIYNKAIGHYEEELKKQPDIPERHKILSDLVTVYYNLGNETKANELDKECDALIHDALKDIKKYNLFLWNSANQFNNGDKKELSSLIFEKFIPINEKTWTAEQILNHRKNIADSFMEGNSFPKAIEHYLIVLDAIPNSEGALLGLGTCYFLMGKKDIAKPYLESYVELYDAKDPRTYSSLAICYLEDKEYDNALEYFLDAAELDNGKEAGYQAAMYNIIGGIYWKNLKDAPNSFKYYRLSMEANPAENVIGDTNLNVLNMSFKPQGMELAQKFWADYPNNKEIIAPPPSLTEEEIKNLPYHFSNIKKSGDPGYEDYIEKMEEDFIEELNSNPSIVEYLNKKYVPASARKFKRHYAEHKARIIQGGEYYSNIKADNAIGNAYNAKEAFELILQKKLFNKQILWRAGNINVPEIEFSGDFDVWRERLVSCPFLDLVTIEELELLKRFMMEDFYSGEPKYWLHSWQDYTNFMEEDEDGEKVYMPEWYNYYDSNLGTGALLSLPDVRGPKEKFYHDLWAKDHYGRLREQQKQHIADGTPRQVFVMPPTRFFAHLEEGPIDEFISKFENDYIRQLQKGWMELKSTTIEDYPEETVNEAIETLKKANEPITLRSDMIWYEAIYLAARNLRNKQTIIDLDAVFEEYLMKKSLPEGIDMSDETTESRKEVIQALLDRRNSYAEEIMKGRELNGESRDFSFLN